VVVDEFVDVFCVGCDALLQKNDTENLFECFAQALEACPNCARLYSHMGTIYYR